MPNVFFADPITRTACENDPKAAETLKRIVNDQLQNGNNLERLKVKHLILSVRVDDSRRILFTYHGSLRDEGGKLIPIILEFDENHSYNSKFLDGKIYQNFFEKQTINLLDELKNNNQPHISSDPVFNHRDVQLSGSTLLEMGGDLLFLDRKQSAISVPGILQGPPGSGKTVTAFSLFSHFVNNLEPDSQASLLYVTYSANLRDFVKKSWDETVSIDKKLKAHVKIYTYAELLSALYPGLPFIDCAKKSAMNYLLSTSGIIGKNHNHQKRYHIAEEFYMEFRMISGYSQPEDYLSSGSNISTYDKSQKISILKAYLEWKKSHENTAYSEIFAIDNRMGEYSKIIVDEAQDFSGAQLRNLIALSKGQTLFCIDPKQNLKDTNGKIVFLQDLFYRFNCSKIEPINLEGSYRCPLIIGQLAKSIDDLRIGLLPKQKNTALFPQSSQDKGSISYVEIMKDEIPPSLLSRAHDIDSFIVTTEQDKPLLIEKGMIRVFTPEEIKGLESKNIILYQPLKDDKFRKISEKIHLNDASEQTSREDNLHLSQPLCALFTSITRAKECLEIYQDYHPVLKPMIDILKKAKSSEAKDSAEQKIDREASLKQAESLFRSGNEAVSKRILEKEVFSGDSALSMKVEKTLASWKSNQDDKNQNHLQGNSAIDNAMPSAKPPAQLNSDKSVSKKIDSTVVNFQAYFKLFLLSIQNNKEDTNLNRKLRDFFKDSRYKELRNLNSSSIERFFKDVEHEFFSYCVEGNFLKEHIELLISYDPQKFLSFADGLAKIPYYYNYDFIILAGYKKVADTGNQQAIFKCALHLRNCAPDSRNIRKFDDLMNQCLHYAKLCGDAGNFILLSMGEKPNSDMVLKHESNLELYSHMFNIDYDEQLYRNTLKMFQYVDFTPTKNYPRLEADQVDMIIAEKCVDHLSHGREELLNLHRPVILEYSPNVFSKIANMIKANQSFKKNMRMQQIHDEIITEGALAGIDALTLKCKENLKDPKYLMKDEPTDCFKESIFRYLLSSVVGSQDIFFEVLFRVIPFMLAKGSTRISQDCFDKMLMHACETQEPSYLMKILDDQFYLKNKMNWTIKDDKSGRSILMKIITKRNKDFIPVIEKMIENDINLLETDSRQHNILAYALIFKLPDATVKKLIKQLGENISELKKTLNGDHLNIVENFEKEMNQSQSSLKQSMSFC
jgi:hypothetical protein